jgi:ATP adenylyltransferase/5',5'''-P-1,P-4-tetraphosphate phosphorylase II
LIVPKLIQPEDIKTEHENDTEDNGSEQVIQKKKRGKLKFVHCFNNQLSVSTIPCETDLEFVMVNFMIKIILKTGKHKSTSSTEMDVIITLSISVNFYK